MAATDRTVKILFQHYLPGGGFNSSGTPKQGKTLVWGKIDVTSYTSNGMNLTALDMGLSTVDSVSFSVLDINGSDVAQGSIASGQWRRDNEVVQFYSDASTEVTATQTVEAGFFAVGDSARDVETLAS